MSEEKTTSFWAVAAGQPIAWVIFLVLVFLLVARVWGIEWLSEVLDHLGAFFTAFFASLKGALK